MEITFNNKELKEALNIVRGGVENNSNHQILSAVLFEINNDILTLNTNDLDLEIKTSKQINNKNNKISFSLKLNDLLNIVLKIDDKEDIKFILEDNHIKMINKKNKFILNTINNQEFKKLELKKEIDFNKINKQEFLNIIKKTIFSIANENPQQFLNGLFLEFKKDKTIAVTSDGHRLSIASFKVNNKLEQSAIIPKKTIGEIKKFLENNENNDIDIFINETNIYIKDTTTIIKSKLISGSYPDYNAILPKDIDIQIKINKESFKKALKQSEIFANENKTTTLIFEDNELIIKSNSEKGNAKTIIDIENFDSSLTTKCNISYLINTLQNIEEENVVFEVNSNDNKMLLLSGENNKNSKYIIMSVRD